MTPPSNPSVATFTPAERTYIRREFHQFFSTFPTVAEGFQLKTWRAGPKQGQPKLSPAAESLVARGLSASTPQSGRRASSSPNRASPRCAL